MYIQQKVKIIFSLLHNSKVPSTKCSSFISKVQRARGSSIIMSRRQVSVRRDNSTTMCSRRRNSTCRSRRVPSHIGLTTWRKLLLNQRPHIRQKQLILLYLPSMRRRLLIPQHQMFRGKLAKPSRCIYVLCNIGNFEDFKLNTIIHIYV